MTGDLCPFCRPELADSVFYEAYGCVGVANIAPIVRGHSLVLPRRHVARLAGLSEAECRDLFAVVQRVAALLMAAHQAGGVDVSVQDGEAAGQTVAHLHVHVIPRRPGDLPRPGDWYDRLIDSAQRPRLTPEQLWAEAAFLRTFLRAQDR